MKGSSTNHYRTGLIKLFDVLEFRSNDTIHRPVLDALRLITRHASAGTGTTTGWRGHPGPPRPGRGPPYPDSAQRRSFLTGNLTFDRQEPSEETTLGPKRS